MRHENPSSCDDVIFLVAQKVKIFRFPGIRKDILQAKQSNEFDTITRSCLCNLLGWF